MGDGKYAEELPALACFLGNDFVGRLNRNGPVMVRQLMSDFIGYDFAGRRRMITRMGGTSTWKRGASKRATDFPEKFWPAYYLQKYPPVFRMSPASEASPVDLADPQSYVVTVEPLNPLPQGWSREDWGCNIGFDGDPSNLLLGDPGLLF